VKSNERFRKLRWKKHEILAFCHKADNTGDPDDDFDEYEPNPGYELLYCIAGGYQLVVSFYPDIGLVLLANSSGNDLEEIEGKIVWSDFRVLKEILP
jgi:hypothetical protein